MNPANIPWIVFGLLIIAGCVYGLWCAWDVDREYRKRERTPEIDWKRNPRVGMDEWDADFRKLSGEPEEPLPEGRPDNLWKPSNTADWSLGGLMPSSGYTWARKVEKSIKLYDLSADLAKLHTTAQKSLADFDLPDTREESLHKAMWSLLDQDLREGYREGDSIPDLYEIQRNRNN